MCTTTRVHTHQGNVREIFFFQSQGIVREFYNVSGKMKCCKNIREMSGNFTFQPDEAGMFGPIVSFLLNSSNFRLGYCQGNLNLS